MLTVLSENIWFIEGVRHQLNAEGISILKKQDIYRRATLLSRLRSKILIIDLSHTGINLQDTLSGIRAGMAVCADIHITVILHKKERVISETLRRYYPGVQILSPELFLEQKSLSALISARSRPECKTLPQHHAASYVLTHREIELLNLLSKGYSQKTIGIITALNLKTVSHYKRSIYRKAGCATLCDFLALTRSMGYPAH
ncbi:helix-turn-helix transcriptional regulator [Pantoea sp. M_9]|uniref:helix-turn-helix domain-containing protein n=1 Tax=Pantoea sp. M_9 TaxID=2608041 RepID=UPI001232625C|nr:LuxR C-terminal-related transcriptional regulator [Pantoea sp. M_9]KAA5971610.1 response regulator transcription factor [Pantoea sp. M_9]